jgi:hypothetical protein
MRIVTLLARHGTQKYPHAVDNVGAMFAHRPGELDHETIVIDNDLPVGYEASLGEGTTLLGSSNESWEFSAWDRGIRHLADHIDDYDLVHLTTSAFQALDQSHLDDLDPRVLDLVVDRPAVVGPIDYYPAPIVVHGYASQAWLRSSWIFLPPRELKLLGSVVSVTDRTALFSGDALQPFRDDGPLSANYQDYIVGWLTGEGTGLGWPWHSRFRLTAETLDYFQAKTAAIINEHMLSVRLRLQGCSMVDPTWLAERRAQLCDGQALGSIPHWTWQVAARDRWWAIA